MPFLRVIRDKRGYETTYLMHWYREGSRQRSKILYVFRTPNGVRVGRTALEPDVLRHIEAQHPDIEFDWNVVRDNQQVVEPPMEQRRRRPRREEQEPDRPAPPPPPAAAAAAGAAPAGPAPPPQAATGTAATGTVAPPGSAAPAIPAAVQGTTPDEQIAFLNEWYPVLLQRIPQRIADPVRQEALLALAERLNPAAWTDADQITGGLQQAAEAWERLARVFARRRRRTRRRPGESRPPNTPAPPAAGS